MHGHTPRSEGIEAEFDTIKAHYNRFNPLTEAQDLIELDQVAEILIKAGKGGQNQGGSGDF